MFIYSLGYSIEQSSLNKITLKPSFRRLRQEDLEF
jgi:hypothetical protein